MMSKGIRVPKISVMSVVFGLVCLLLLVAIGLSPKNVAANTTHCSLELDNEKRDLCFQSNPLQQYEQRRPGWPILNTRSYATGNPNASITRTAEEQVMCGDTEGTTSIGLHCGDDGMRVVFSMGCSFGNPNSPTIVELETDANSSQWRAKVFRNRLGLSIDDSITANKFVKSMHGNEKIVLVFAPMGAPKFAATFKLEGFQKAIKRVEELCPI